MDTTSVYAPITKSYEQDDGTVLVEGIITDSNLDLDQQRCDPEWLRTAVPAWMSFGNLREQHDKYRAIGKAIEHKDLGDAGHFIRGRVSDPVAVAKVKGGVFNGFSIGVKDYHLTKSADAPNGVIDGGKICEVSLVDYPCNENCRLTMVKSAKPGMQVKSGDFDAERLLVRCEELIEKTVEPDMKKAQMTVTLAEALPKEQVERLGELTVDKGVTPAVETVEEAQAAADEVLESSKSAADDVPLQAEPSDEAETVTDPATEPLPVAEFDADAAKALVAAVAGKEGADAAKAAGEFLAKADPGDVPPAYSDEQGDVLNAQAAIAIIGKLIVSEASELVNNPAEACDIAILLQAIGALRCFIGREQQQSLGENDVDTGMACLAADADVTKDSDRPYGDVEYADPGYQADKNKRYPLDTKAHAKAAWDYINKTANADEYSSEQLASMKSKIKAACKKFGIEVEADSSKATDIEETAVSEPDTTKATGADSLTDPDVLVKAVMTALESEDSPLTKMFKTIVEASAETTVKSLSELSERLVQVESMATPGGPALRRTEVETKSAQKSDLLRQEEYWRTMSETAKDRDLQKGWAVRADEYKAKAAALGL